MAEGQLPENSDSAGGHLHYGFADCWEFVVQGQFETPLSANCPTSLAATGAFLKYIVKPGVLQDQTGLTMQPSLDRCGQR
jgi:hypothetical protein